MSDPTETHSIRVFLDANVLYAAALGGGCCQLWAIKGVQLVTSEYAAHEAWVNLRSSPATEECRLNLLRLLEPPLDFVPWKDGPRPQFSVWQLPDPDDVPILVGAIESRCDYLLTGDVECFGRYFGTALDGVMILKPGKFMAMRGL